MATKKRGLGKGLSALIPNEPEDDIKGIGENSVVNIDISLIEPNEEQPRNNFNDDSLLELSKSISAHGILQPIIVRKLETGYQIVAGERRWRAARVAGLKEVPCIIKELKLIESAEIALIENIQREDLNSIEEGLAYKNLMNKYDLTQEEIANIVGKSRSYIANTTRLLNLDSRVVEYIRNGYISTGHGRALLALDNKEVQFKTADIILEKKLSVRETEKLINGMKKQKKAAKNRKQHKDPLILTIEESLRKTLGTKVEINKKKNKGKIEIEYYNDEDLERIVELISKR